MTREWRAGEADRFEPVASELVLEEASEADLRTAAERLPALESTHLLDVTDDSRALGRALLRARAMPSEAIQDAAHVAMAVVQGIAVLHGSAQGRGALHVQLAQQVQEAVAECGERADGERDAAPGEVVTDLGPLAHVEVALQANPQDQVMAKALAGRG